MFRSIRTGILLVIIISFLSSVSGPGEPWAAVLLDRVVAVVNNEVITWSELRKAVQLEGKEFLEKVPEGSREEVMKQMEHDFLNNIIDMKLQLQEAQRKGIDVSAAEVEGAIADIRKKFGLTEEVLVNSLKAEGLTLDEYRMKLKEQILLSKLVNFEVRAKVVVQDSDIEKYYLDNRDKFAGREKRRIRQIFFPAPKDPAAKAELALRAEGVMKRLEAGEGFEKLADELSGDTGRLDGGDLGYITRGSVLREVEDVAFSLRAGEMSKPFWSSSGLHIIKLEDTIEAESLDKARDRIRDVLFEKAAEARYIEWKSGLKQKAYIEIKL